MTPRVRKLALTAHVTCSVGWLGGVAAFLVLAVAGRTSQSDEVIRSAYISSDLIGRFALLPLSVASLLTGLVLALGTPWGLVRHYWVLTKFVLTVLAAVGLVLHQFTAGAGAARLVSGAAAGTLPGAELRALGTQLVVDASLALLVLLATTALSVFKPWGRTPYGRREQGESGEATATSGAGLKIALAVVGVILLVFAVSHLAGGGLHAHGAGR
ncbi:MAG: hypothetical protein KF878_01145 [Planctomycetes bacterium]|nr:hypothetical protein [Planctomycetota bacterium]MCW8137622.1 hypothetical protein [Planctomycetota bacterium]